ncbi:hypothetical protein OSB04_027358 [Centaurea solstitialis]|uniref:DRBM domain-containing protein n=1 Tax=Centaurea solstitialis TaxID=347529 RepID=A0AA38SX80_9ASTR|nr:hypothetical protein OSB04_027358 [Centaurea solstitialis]
MAEVQNVDASTQPVAAGETPQLYKSLLNEYAQKLWKQIPIYQTSNEGSDHQPKFRSTVWANGVSYTSPNTFPQKKMAEMDVSKIAFLATKQKLKDDALRLVREDKSFCKSILVEYAVRMNVPKPAYQTSQLETTVPVFRSSLVVNGVSCTGADCKSKKEAEQSAARAIILKFLDSDSENIMSEIINCKFRNHAEMKDIPSAQNATSVVVQAVVDNITNAVVQTAAENSNNAVVQTAATLNEAKVEEGTKMVNTSALPPEPSLVQGTTVIPPRPMPETSTPVTTPVPTVFAMPPSVNANSAPIPGSVPSLESLARIIAAHLSSNMVPPGNNSEAPTAIVTPPLSLSSPASAQTAVASQTSGKKRNRKNKKNAQKKMRTEDQSAMPAMAVGQSATFSAQ